MRIKCMREWSLWPRTMLFIGIIGLASAVAIFADEKDAVIDQALDAAQNPTTSSGSDAAIDPTVGILDFHDQDILDVLKMIADKTRLNIIADDHIRGRVTIYLDQVDVWDALRTILEMHDLAYSREGDQVKIMTDDEFASFYGSKFNVVVQTRLVPLTNIMPEEMTAVLTPHKSEQGKIIPINKTKSILLIDEPSNIESMTGLIKARDVAMETKTFTLRHVTTQDIKIEIEKLLTPDVGTIVYGENFSQFTITDTAERIKILTLRIAALDREVEIAFVGQVIQIGLNEEHQKGIDWEAIVTHYRSVGIVAPEELAPSEGKLSIGTISQEDEMVLMESLGTVGAMQTVGSPSVTIKLKQEAGIPLALTNPFHLAPNDFHLELTVLPGSIKDNVIRLSLNPKFHWLAADHKPLPVTNSPVDISLKDSEMIVVGGLFQEKVVTLEKRAPWLGGLPVVGSFFKKHQDHVEKTEFVIFLTPKIMIEGNELLAIDKQEKTQ